MILKNITENDFIVDVNGAKVTIEAGVKFSVRDTQWEQLLNMYPNSLSEVIILDEKEETPDDSKE